MGKVSVGRVIYFTYAVRGGLRNKLESRIRRIEDEDSRLERGGRENVVLCF